MTVNIHMSSCLIRIVGQGHGSDLRCLHACLVFLLCGSRGLISPRQVYETEITHCVLYISGVRAILK